MATKSRRAYKGAAVTTTLSAPINNTTDITISVVANMSTSGWDYSGTPFFCVIDPGKVNEEKVCVIYTGINTLTVVDPAVTSGWSGLSGNVNGRAADNTSIRSHDAGAVIYPVFTAYEANQANELVSKYASTGAMVYQDATSFATLALGTAGYPLLAGASAPIYGQVDTVGIADSAVTSAKIAANTIVQADVATVLLKLVCPVGTISAYGGATAPTGWLLCNGTATTGYTELIALVGATTPNLKGKVVVGLNSAETEFDTLFETGGAKTVTLTAAESGVPVHGHGITSQSFTGTLGSVSSTSLAHSHTGTSDSAGSHNHNANTSSGPSAVHGHTILDRIAHGASNQTVTYMASVLDAAPDHQHTFTTASALTTHDHTITPAGSIAVVIANNSSAAAASAHNNLQPYMALNYIIKHDY